MLRIKLVRTGRKDLATWRVVVIDRKKTGKGKVSEYIGHYNPTINPKEFVLDLDRYDHWVGVGAQPTDAILRLKGRYIDKNKDYQKLVKPKLYKSKKEEEAKEPANSTGEDKTPSTEGEDNKKDSSEKADDDSLVAEKEKKEEIQEEPKDENDKEAGSDESGSEKSEEKEEDK